MLSRKLVILSDIGNVVSYVLHTRMQHTYLPIIGADMLLLRRDMFEGILHIRAL